MVDNQGGLKHVKIKENSYGVNRWMIYIPLLKGSSYGAITP